MYRDTIYVLTLILLLGALAFGFVGCIKGTEINCGQGKVVDMSYRASTLESHIATGITSGGDVAIASYSTGESEKRTFVVYINGEYKEFKVNVDTFYRYNIGDTVTCWEYQGKWFNIPWKTTVR